jgi:hypothetical protein
MSHTTTLKIMCIIILLRMLCKNERYYIRLTSKKGSDMPLYLSLAYLQLMVSIPAPPCQVQISMLIGNIIKSQLEDNLSFSCFDHICILFVILKTNVNFIFHAIKYMDFYLLLINTCIRGFFLCLLELDNILGFTSQICPFITLNFLI